MGVVHLARRGEDGDRVALKVLRPHIVGDDEARGAAGPRGLLAEPDHAAAGSPRSWTPTRGARCPYVATRYVPGLSLHDHVARGGPDRGARPHLVRGLPRRGRRVGARGRRAAPRREAEQRADGGPDADPHRLRPGPGRRRPQADPHRLAARHARATSRPRSCTATTPPPPPTCTRGRPPSPTPRTGRPPFGRGPSMAIMDRVRRGEHDLSGIPEPLRGLLAEALDPEPHQRPTLTEILEPGSRPADRARRAERAPSR